MPRSEMFALCWATTFTFSLILQPTFLLRFISRLDKSNTDCCFSPFDSSLHNMSLLLHEFTFVPPPATPAYWTCVGVWVIWSSITSLIWDVDIVTEVGTSHLLFTYTLSMVVSPVVACNLDSLIILTGGHVDNRTKSTVWGYRKGVHPYTKRKYSLIWYNIFIRK